MTRLRLAASVAGLALDTRHFRQGHAMCGPASLRIVFAYFGSAIPEKVIASACRSTNAAGTRGANLIRGARHFGFEARLIDGANLRMVAQWLRRDIPVIVDWMSAIVRRPTQIMLPCGHYSVVCGLDRQHILLQDAAIGCRRRIARRDFLNLWYDFVRVRPTRRDLILRRLIVVRPGRTQGQSHE